MSTNRTSRHMFDRLSSRFSAIKEDIADAVKERSRSISFDRHNAVLSTSASSIGFSCREGLAKTSGNNGSLSSLGPTTDRLALHKGVPNIRLNSTTNAAHLINSNATGLSLSSTLASIEDVSTPVNDDDDDDGNERLIDPVQMTAKPTIVLVPPDSIGRSSTLHAEPKFRVNRKEPPRDISLINSDILVSVSIIVGVLSLAVTVWKPISSYFSGLIVGGLFALAVVYIAVRMVINAKVEESLAEEWLDFPALDSLLNKVDQEDKNTNIQVTGASMSFQRYDADRDENFVRYPCDVRLDGYRLIIQLASKPWTDERKSDKEVKFIGCREYLVKEARMILVPEVTLTRAKYWMIEYPIVIQDLQVLDKQIFNKQQLEKSKAHVNDFFINNATIISIWFETGLQKEEWFHKLSLVLRKGKEEIRRINDLLTGSSASLGRRRAQTESDVGQLRSLVADSQLSFDLQKKESDKDATGTHRTRARTSAKRTPNETCLERVLQTPECLDEAAVTVNFVTRRLLCDMFTVPVLKDLLKEKIEMKLKELAVSILENLRVVSIDLGSTFPIILKIEPMQWNTQGLWFNLFLYYRGSFKLSVRTRVLLQKLINYDPTKDKPMFAQHHSAQQVHRDDERIDENDLVHRQKLLAKEPEIAEMAVTRRLGTALTNLALNKYFQIFANFPLVRALFEKFSQQEVGADVEVTGFCGVLTLNIPPPPSDRIWVGCPEMPDLKINVTPTYGAQQYSYTLLQDFLSAKIRSELKRLIVLPAMDDQLLPFFRDWAIDVIGEIVSKPVNPQSDNYTAKMQAHAAVREGLHELQRTARKIQRATTISSIFPDAARAQT